MTAFFTRKFLFHALFFFILVSPTLADARNYYIYGDKLEGTKFREKVYSWPVALRKSYDKLSKQQKAIVLKDYPNLGQGDRPPYPAKGVLSIIEPYVREFRYYGIETDAGLVAQIDSDGRVQVIKMSQETDPRIERFMKRLLRKVEFEPGTCSGQPCGMDYVLTLKKIDNPRFERNF